MAENSTAPELIKSVSSTELATTEFRRILKRFVVDKEYKPRIVKDFAEQALLSLLLQALVLRRRIHKSEELDTAGSVLNQYNPANITPYIGLMEQNAKIDRALSTQRELREPNNFFGLGTSSYFSTDSYSISLPFSVLSVPIAIIGYGAAGIMLGFALNKLGFNRIRVFEKSKSLGIWSMKDVYGGSRNNPRLLKFYNGNLHPAPGSGDEVKSFLEEHLNCSPKQQTAVKIVPGDLSHEIHFSDGDIQNFPIVINAIGLGKPKPVSSEQHMKVEANQLAGHRWQRRLTFEEVKGKRFILIGLGNSTAEMLRQIHDYIDQGYDVDYRVITHYPEESVQNPDFYVDDDDKLYRVFRDLSIPNLVDYQGDLADSRFDYFRALRSGKIISEVKNWFSDHGTFTALSGFGRTLESVAYDKIYTLIGYRHPKETIMALGCEYDSENQCGRFDYDGEYIASIENHGRSRLKKGCFGFGSVLETPQNQNAIVIPGMLHRIGDLVFGITMRAAEYAAK